LSPQLTPDRARDLLRRMRGRRILVLGDLMLDRFLWGNVSRISPEAPVPVVHLERETSALGGAGNVARNLKALGGVPDLVAAVGGDAGAEQLRRCLDESGLDPGGIVEVPGRTTTVKSRVLAQHQQMLRIDRETTDPLPAGAVQGIARAVRDRLDGAAALLVSDYDKGVVSGPLLREVLPTAAAARIPVAIDPKPTHTEHYRPCTVLTPNVAEARLMAGVRTRGEQGTDEAAESLRRQLGTSVLVTRGEQGMTLYRDSHPPLPIPASAREVFDVTGAGDTVIAVLTLALAADGTLEESAVLANLAAGCVVGKLGTAVTGPEEILESLSRIPTP
jgi:D-beta-D-heptose 7-phosphate kinase/D-beta-D-heptose 1-phosphate adenosyltransferase